MATTEMVLSGKVNKDIVNLFQNHGVSAAGISGKDGKTILAKKISLEGADIGMVGEIDSIDTTLITVLLDNNFTPVIAPVSSDREGETLNINADNAAAAIASALKAEKLIFLTDTPGIMKDINNKDSLYSELEISDVKELIKNGTISGGMIPKIECAADAVREGVNSVHIIDGRVEHSLLLEIFTKRGIGSLVYKGTK